MRFLPVFLVVANLISNPEFNETIETLRPRDVEKYAEEHGGANLADCLFAYEKKGHTSREAFDICTEVDESAL